ncbi:hypothetical protein GCM10009846_06170 [Agrococcus versicolor]|uniref:DUF4190 domain-containing protein n=1 Tax=Agrococcus versicolor TaxID=501482 RepID=A0ABP5MAL0_9MICO
MTQPQTSLAPSKTWSITSLILGIVSLAFGYTLLVPIAGIVVGVMAKSREPHARGMANWGIGLSIAAIVLGILLVVLFGGLILAGLGLGAVSST